MKPYVKPVFEKVDLMPNERLSNSSCMDKRIVCDKDGDGKVDWGEYVYYMA